jgi:trehalose 6-phosphate synthase/phosphatase
MGRLLIVSNRLPVTIRAGDGPLEVERSVGGLATGLAGPHAESGGLWIGWPGIPDDTLTPPQREALAARLAGERLVGVPMDTGEVERYYAGFCNGFIWPVFHYLTGHVPLWTEDWAAYRAVNERFAEAVAAAWAPGDVIWVHDYQLLLLPGLLRERLPDAPIGFFLHIPFPATEVYRTLPGRQQLLAGVLGADLVGFHTRSYMRHFSAAVLRLLGRPTEVDRVTFDRRAVRLTALPMGIDAARFADLGGSEAVADAVRELRGDGSVRVMLSIDRLDYTKGLPRRLLAFERMLERHPGLRGRVRLVMLVVPSREDVDAYQDFRDEINALVGRINGAFATAHWAPVHYMYRGLPVHEVAALYRAADVMLVTPICDGMNLVAKEYVATRTDDDGVLVLSEFAGAADELVEAVTVNPYEVDQTAEAFRAAPAMDREERRRRMRALRERVTGHTVHGWVRTFLAELDAAAAHRAPHGLAEDPAGLARAVEAIGRAPRRALLLDYDGTLVPYHPDPEQAVPDTELEVLLRRLADRRDTEVHIVSGRGRAFLERWLGRLPVHLHAEHGGWSRPTGAGGWTAAAGFPLQWRGVLRPVLEDFARRTPGAFVEVKELGLCWHWRAADEDVGARHASELGLHLLHVAANLPVDVLVGDHVVELRPQGASKAAVAERVVPGLAEGTAIVAAGDDRTDEDLFAALPAGAWTVHVGSRSTRARFTVPDHRALRAFLEQLAR